MAQRRMFSLKIVASDAFLDLPTSSRELYFQLGMYSDDDGFVNPKKIIRMVGASEDDIKLLIAKRFILPFENGVVVIKHWLINNLIRKDFYQETIYLEQKKQLIVKENKAYSESQQNVNNLDTQVRLGKDSIEKVSLIDKEAVASKPTPKEQAEKFFNNIDNSQLKVLTWLIEKGVPRSTAEQELKKFINYWAELTPSGKKQKWQTKPTFEVSRRLATWFSNFDKFTKTRGNSGGQTAKI